MPTAVSKIVSSINRSSSNWVRSPWISYALFDVPTAERFVRLGFTATTGPLVDVLFAHRAFCAKLILRRPAADMVC
jgi:hypothetical protein